MAKLLMITGLGSARDLASGKRGAFYNTLEEFSKYWTRIDIICPKLTSLQAYRLTGYFGNVYVHISSWPLIFHPAFFISKALKIYKEQKFDLMTVHDFPPFYNGLGARLLWQKIRVPYILEIFHVPGYPRAANTKESIYKFLFKLFIRFDASKAKVVRVMNSQVFNFLIKAGVPKEKIIYIPAIYIDTDIFKPTGVQKEYDLIFVGRLEKNKGISLLLEALSKLKVKSEKLKVLIVGTGPLLASLKLKVKSEKLENNIIFWGYAKDSQEVAELLNKSKVLVMPSYNEGGPRVVVEALACGVPILATPVGIVPDLLKNLPDGRQAALGGEIIDWKADDIAQKISGLLSDSVRYQKYSQNGPEIAKQFEKKVSIKNYAEKLKNLINK